MGGGAAAVAFELGESGCLVLGVGECVDRFVGFSSIGKSSSRESLSLVKSKIYMDKDYQKTIIGYSGFILFDECYEYNENACYIAGSQDLLRQFMSDCGFNKTDFRVDEVSISMLESDYGCSSGEYAMEQLAFENFKKVADGNGLKYIYEAWDMDPNLTVVNF